MLFVWSCLLLRPMWRPWRQKWLVFFLRLFQRYFHSRPPPSIHPYSFVCLPLVRPAPPFHLHMFDLHHLLLRPDTQEKALHPSQLIPQLIPQLQPLQPQLQPQPLLQLQPQQAVLQPQLLAELQPQLQPQLEPEVLQQSQQEASPQVLEGVAAGGARRARPIRLCNRPLQLTATSSAQERADAAATDEESRREHGVRGFTDGLNTYVLTTLPALSPHVGSRVLVWRREGAELTRHCVVADSTTLNSALRKGGERGLFAWGIHVVQADTCFGQYSGLEQSFATEAEAAEAHAQLPRSCRGYCMQFFRGGRWVLVDARSTPDSFLRFVNSPEGLGFSENAHICPPHGSIRASEDIPPFSLHLTDAENSGSEIWAEYTNDRASDESESD